MQPSLSKSVKLEYRLLWRGKPSEDRSKWNHCMIAREGKNHRFKRIHKVMTKYCLTLLKKMWMIHTESWKKTNRLMSWARTLELWSTPTVLTIICLSTECTLYQTTWTDHSIFCLVICFIVQEFSSQKALASTNSQTMAIQVYWELTNSAWLPSKPNKRGSAI